MICAYNLDIDITALRNELKFLNDPDCASHKYNDEVFFVADETFKQAGCFEVQKFKEMLGDPFVAGVRYMNMSEGDHFKYHSDNNDQGFHEMPLNAMHPANINILLSKPKGDITTWSIDSKMKKIHPWSFSKMGIKHTWPTHRNEYMTEDSFNHTMDDQIEVDRFEITDKPCLFNAATWHAVKVNEAGPRQTACFVFWYNNTWNGIVEVMRHRGLLEER